MSSVLFDVEAIPGRIRTLSLLQPWATLIAAGMKKVETRSWPTPYRGPLAIHASARIPLECRDLCREEPFRGALVAAGITRIGDLPLGAVLAVCELVECRFTGPEGYGEPGWIAGLPAQEQAFGNYEPGRWGWFLEDVRRLESPVPAKGALGLWLWEPDAAGRVGE